MVEQSLQTWIRSIHPFRDRDGAPLLPRRLLRQWNCASGVEITTYQRIWWLDNNLVSSNDQQSFASHWYLCRGIEADQQTPLIRLSYMHYNSLTHQTTLTRIHQPPQLVSDSWSSHRSDQSQFQSHKTSTKTLRNEELWIVASLHTHLEDCSHICVLCLLQCFLLLWGLELICYVILW